MAKSGDYIDALALLTEQHGELDALFELLGRKRRNRQEVFVELADKLAAHAAIEEKLFYPRIMSSETTERLREAVQDHLGIKRVLADMLTMDLGSIEFDARLAALKAHVSHHAHEEEEARLFPLVREALTAAELGALGNELSVMFEHLMAVEPRKQVPNETAAAAALWA